MSQVMAHMANGEASINPSNGLQSSQTNHDLVPSEDDRPGPSRLSAPPRPHQPPDPMIEQIFQTDLYEIKQELHDALGESGLPYWKALNGYLLGQVGRQELEVMVRGWLRGPKLQLHNRFLLALIYQANLPSFGPGSDSTRKRKRVTPEDAEFDINENAIVPKGRIQYWMMGIGGKERGRIRRAGRQQALEDADGDDDGARRVRAWGVQPGTTMPPLAASAKLLPASHQLSHRLSQLAKSYDLNLSPDALADIGEFMAVGMDAQLSDIFYSLLHLIARDRRGSETTKLNGHVNADEMDLDIKAESDGEMLKPDLRTLRALFSMNPGLHPSTSPALYKLAGALLQAEDEYNSPAVKEERKPSLSPDGTKDAGPESQKDRFETLTKRFVEEGLVKMDNPKKGEEDGGGKKDRKHNLHWKYEDPALILKDVFG